MLYKFKSDAGADVIMLEVTGRHVLEIMGKSHDPKGILLPEHMPAAMAAIEAAIAQEEQAGKPTDELTDEPADQARQHISLRTRAWPLVSLIERSLEYKVPITWGV
jgi:hypothetical protein